MIRLTPLENTVGGQELIQMGIKNTALNLLKMNILTMEQIAQATNLSIAEVKKLRQKLRGRRGRKNDPAYTT